MAKKITITEKQAEQFNYMLAIHRKIARDYQTPDQLRKNSEKQYGLDYEESLEMAYENLQSEAGAAAKGVRPITIPVDVAAREIAFNPEQQAQTISVSSQIFGGAKEGQSHD